MPTPTDYHTWDTPDADDPDWDTLLEAIFEAIDAETQLVVVEGESTPDPTDPPPILNDTDPEGWPTLEYPSGGQFDQIETAQRWDTELWAWRDREQHVIAQWIFDEDAPQNADLDGNAASVGEADLAREASDTLALDGKDPEQFDAAPGERTITGTHTHTQAIRCGGGLSLTEGTLALPTYDARDPDDAPGDVTDPDPEPTPTPDPSGPQPPVVQTGHSVVYSSLSVQCFATLESLGGYDELHCSISIRERGAEAWQQTKLAATRTTPGGFSVVWGEADTVADGSGDRLLNPSTTYEYRGEVTPQHGAAGFRAAPRTFTTPDSLPFNAS